jgi:hypothetical protein
MFFAIPTGRKYTSTVRSEYTRRCMCEQCGTEFTYSFTVTGTGTGSSPLWLRNDAATEEAKKAAVQSMERAAQSAFPPAACPKCGIFQSAMLKYYRRTRYPRLLALSVTVLVVVALFSWLHVLNFGMISLLTSEIFWPSILVPAALLGFVIWARKYSVPRAASR